MKLDKFLDSELNEMEALEIRGGISGEARTQLECTNTVAYCGGNVPQLKCTNNAPMCGQEPPGLDSHCL